EPLLCRSALTFWAVPVAAGVIGDSRESAVLRSARTCPPSAAVRQRSIADITLSWPRLTWPVLAVRHAAPKLRKMSATSRAGQDMLAGSYAGGSFLFARSGVRRSNGLVIARIVLLATCA